MLHLEQCSHRLAPYPEMSIVKLLAICLIVMSFLNTYAYVAQIDVERITLVSNCTWSFSANDTQFVFAQSQFERHWDSFMPPESFRSEVCRYGDVYAFRVGPFATSGGFSWNAVAASFVSSTFPAFRPQLFGVSAYLIGNTDGVGSIIGYPPIHQHHFHLYGSGDDSQIMNNHGDNQCLERSGGAMCLEHRLPAGFAYIIHSPVGFHTEFNDVRSMNTSVMVSWVVVAMRFLLYDPHVRQVAQQMIEFPATVGAPSNRATFLLRSDMSYVVWTNATLRAYVLDNLIEAYLHTHYALVAELWLFRGTADTVFNDPQNAAPSWRKLLVGQIGTEMLKRNIETRQLQPGAATRIWSLRSAETAEIFHGRTYYRKAVVGLRPGDENLVFIALFNSSLKVTVEGMYPMHCGIRVYYARHATKVVYRDALPKSVDELLMRNRLRTHHSMPSILAQYSSFSPLREHSLASGSSTAH